LNYHIINAHDNPVNNYQMDVRSARLYRSCAKVDADYFALSNELERVGVRLGQRI